MKKIITSIILTVIISTKCFSQTTVGGGIFSNTTWTLANSPYIITDSVVVFQNVTLTIEPGVVVKFDDNQQLEIRQGVLIANGTSSAPVIFTSNSPTPYPGIYSGILIKNDIALSQFNYCIVEYAKMGLNASFQNNPGLIIKHCIFQYNVDGIAAYSQNSLLDSCDIKYNTALGEEGFYNITNCHIIGNRNGIHDGFAISYCVIDSNFEIGISENSGSIQNCLIRNDSIGIQGGNPTLINNCIITNNKIGIQPHYNQTITNCLIDSNITGIDVNGFLTGYILVTNCNIEYNVTGISDLANGMASNTFTRNIIDNNSIGIMLSTIDTISCNSICNNTTYGLKYLNIANTNCAANNYWCTTDSASTTALIYDGYDNINYGLVYFMPIDTTQCFLANGIFSSDAGNFSFNIFPNPSSDYIIVELPELNYKSKTEIKITNLLGELEYSSILKSQHTKIDISNLKYGIHILEIISNDKIGRQKFIKE